MSGFMDQCRNCGHTQRVGDDLSKQDKCEKCGGYMSMYKSEPFQYMDR